MTTADQERPTRAGLVTGLTFVAALVFIVVLRGGAFVIGIGLLFLVFVPLEKLFALRPQKVFRKGLVTDLTHFVVNNVFVTIGAIVLVVVAAIPLLLDPELQPAGLPADGRVDRARGGARVRRQLLGSPAHPHRAVALAVPLRAPQHRADGLGRRGSAPPVRLRVHAGVHDHAVVRARLRRRRVRRRRGVHHAARDLPARQRAHPLPGAALDRSTHPSGTTGTTRSTTKRATRTSASPSSTRSSAPRTCRRAGAPPASAPTPPSPKTATCKHLAYPFTKRARPHQPQPASTNGV